MTEISKIVIENLTLIERSLLEVSACNMSVFKRKNYHYIFGTRSPKANHISKCENFLLCSNKSRLAHNVAWHCNLHWYRIYAISSLFHCSVLTSKYAKQIRPYAFQNWLMFERLIRIQLVCRSSYSIQL